MSCNAKLFLGDCIDVMHQLIDEGIKKEVVFVGRFYPSSKTCHKCGYVNKELTLNDREWTCPVCGVHHDRDLNAAINILMEGERIIGVRSTEYTLVEKPTVDDRTLCS